MPVDSRHPPHRSRQRRHCAGRAPQVQAIALHLRATRRAPPGTRDTTRQPRQRSSTRLPRRRTRLQARATARHRQTCTAARRPLTPLHRRLRPGRPDIRPARRSSPRRALVRRTTGRASRLRVPISSTHRPLPSSNRGLREESIRAAMINTPLPPPRTTRRLR